MVGVGEPVTFTVTGTAGLEGFDSFGGSATTYVPLATAQELLDLPGQVLSIEVQTDDQTSLDEMIRRIGPVLPDGVEAVSAQSAAEEQLATFKDALGFLNTFLLVFAGVTVFVAAFLIQNTFRIIVAQRTQELAMLRAVGASRRQVIGMVLGEATIVAVIASVAGLGLGVILAQLIRRLLSFGGALPSAPLQLAGRTVLVGLATGIVITVVSAVLPARSASRVPPIAALRKVQVPDSKGLLRRRAIIGLDISGLGVALMTVGLVLEREDQTIPDIALVGAGAGLIFIGVAALLAVVAKPITAFIGRPLKATGLPGRLAVDNAGRSPRRTAATASALMVGLALVGLTLVLADSLKTTRPILLDERFQADLVISPAGFGGSRLSPELAPGSPNCRRSNCVGRSRRPGRGRGRDPIPDRGRAIDPGRTGQLHHQRRSYHRHRGRQHRCASGPGRPPRCSCRRQLTSRFARSGDQVFNVAAIYDARGLGAGLMVDRSTFAANFTEQFDDQIFIDLVDGISIEEGRTAVEAVSEEFVGAEVLDQSEFRQQASTQIDQLVRLVFGLLGVAVVIAIFGITNTLSLSVLERTREIGLLRAVGMSRGQLRRSITWESALIAVLGATIGMGLGLFFAWAVVAALDDDVLVLSIPWGQVALRPCRRRRSQV